MFFPADQPLSRQLPNLNACNMLQTTEVFIIHRAWVPSLCTDIMAVYKKNHKGQLNTDTVGGKLVKQDKKKKCLFLKWHLLFSGQIPTQSSSFNLHTFYWMCRPIYTGKDQRIPWTVTLTKCFFPPKTSMYLKHQTPCSIPSPRRKHWLDPWEKSKQILVSSWCNRWPIGSHKRKTDMGRSKIHLFYLVLFRQGDILDATYWEVSDLWVYCTTGKAHSSSR